MKALLSGTILLLLFACTERRQDLYIDVKALKGKNPDEVAEILGKPDTAFTKSMVNKRIHFQIYNDKNITLQYEGGSRLAEIVVKNPNLPFSKESIEAFGLELIQPTQENENVLINWKNYPDFSNVSVYAKGYAENGEPNMYDFYFKYKK
jgi:hypothetical protein